MFSRNDALPSCRRRHGATNPRTTRTDPLQLPMKDLLFAQKVSRHWKQQIETSTRVQEALFFKIAPDGRFQPESIPHELAKEYRFLPLDGKKQLVWPAHVNCLLLEVVQDIPVLRLRLRFDPDCVDTTASCWNMYFTQPQVEVAWSTIYRYWPHFRACFENESIDACDTLKSFVERLRAKRPCCETWPEWGMAAWRQGAEEDLSTHT